MSLKERGEYENRHYGNSREVSELREAPPKEPERESGDREGARIETMVRSVRVMLG
jgi:hypothetical protein